MVPFTWIEDSAGGHFATPEETAAFWALVVKRPESEGGCWIGPARAVTAYGQVQLFIDGRFTSRVAHRIAWMLINGPIPADHLLHHQCRVKACCNPAHLEPLTSFQHTSIHARMKPRYSKPPTDLATRLNTEPSTPPGNRQAPQSNSAGTWGTADVAHFCRVSPGSVRKWIRTGLIPAVGGRIADSTLQAVLEHGLPLPRDHKAWLAPDLAADLHPEWAEVA